MADSEEQVMKFCGNCKKDISAVNFVMHEAHCFRHIVLCKNCEEPIPKAEVEQHFRDQHEKIPCEKCGQQVEKMHLEQHENDDCPKKPQKCLYCDLEFPKSDLKTHLDYCGSRTEQCPKCSQFILFRDQLQHEETDCSYPVPKPTPDNSSATDMFNFFGDSAQSSVPFGIPHAGYGQLSPQEHISPFVLDEMNRFLNNRPVAPHVLGSNMSDLVGHPSSYFQPLERRNEISQPKRNNFDTWQSRPGPEQFVDAEDLTSPSGSADGNLDYLLALHLAQDLNSADGHQDSINTYEGDDRWEPLVETTQHLSLTELSPSSRTDDFSTVPDSTVEEAEIPCEFCGEPLPADMVVQHQSGCEFHLSSSHSDSELRDRSLPSDINSSRPLPNQPPVQIPIVNNLSFTGAPMRGADIPDRLEHEDTMLPCEFCKALLPLDFLVQHQAVCEAEGAPRPDTPDAPGPAVQAKVKNNNITRKEKVSNIARSSNAPRSRSSRHQEDPKLQMFNCNPGGREKATKAVNLRNMPVAGSTNGAKRATTQPSFLMKMKVNRETLPSQPVTRRRQPLSQTENISSHDSGQRSQAHPHEELPSSSIHHNISDEDLLGESSASAAVKPKLVPSHKAVKQRNNREKQTGGQRTLLGEGRSTRTSRQREGSDEGAANGMSFQPSVRGLSSRQPPSSSLVRQSVSNTSAREAQSNSSVRHPGSTTSSSNPRRSGNQVFSGPTKRTTPKRRLPDPPS